MDPLSKVVVSSALHAVPNGAWSCKLLLCKSASALSLIFYTHTHTDDYTLIYTQAKQGPMCICDNKIRDSYFEVSNVSEEEANKGKSQRPFRDSAHHMCHIPLQHTHKTQHEQSFTGTTNKGIRIAKAQLHIKLYIYVLYIQN